MKESLEKTWTMMLLLYCSLTALVVAILAIRFLAEILSENEISLHLTGLHWGACLSIVAVIALRMAWSPETGAPCPSGSIMPWRFWAPRVAEFALFSSAILLPVSGASITLWDGQDINYLGHVLIAAGPKNTELRNLCLVLHEISAVILVLSLAGRITLALTFADQKHIWRRPG